MSFPKGHQSVRFSLSWTERAVNCGEIRWISSFTCEHHQRTTMLLLLFFRKSFFFMMAGIEWLLQLSNGIFDCVECEQSMTICSFNVIIWSPWWSNHSRRKRKFAWNCSLDKSGIFKSDIEFIQGIIPQLPSLSLSLSLTFSTDYNIHKVVVHRKHSPWRPHHLLQSIRRERFCGHSLFRSRKFREGNRRVPERKFTRVIC